MQRVGTKRLAQILDTSERSIYNLAKSGRIPFVWVGARRKYDPDEVMKALQKEKEDADAGNPRGS